MKLPAAIAIMTTALLSPAYGAVDTVPNMKGIWVTTSTDNSVGYGQSEHHSESNKDALFFSHGQDQFTLTIDQQEGRRFAGKFSSPNATEIVVGVLSPDLQSGVMAAHEGQHTFKLVGQDRMEKCYTQSSPHTVAACSTWEKKK
jgi:hypothetical protein